MSRPNLLPLCAAALLLAACVPAPKTTDSDAESTTDEPATSTGEPDPTTTNGGFELICNPGEERCADGSTREVCRPTGLAWETIACDKYQGCQEDMSEKTATCVGPCERAADVPSSVGCEFVAIRMRSFNSSDAPEDFDALIVGNTDEQTAAELQLYVTPNGSVLEEQFGDPVTLAPGESHIFTLSEDVMRGYTSLRTGGVYRLKSDIPVIAYLHSPLINSASNDSSALLPMKTFRREYVIASYPPFANGAMPDEVNGRPSYFNVIALENDTKVEWVPRADTSGDGLPVLPTKAKETGSVTLNKFEVLQIGASSETNIFYNTQDVSGTRVTGSKPIWVMGATSCAFVPVSSKGFCNHLQEQMLPIEYWGKIYVGAHSPVRTEEKHYWRVYAGKANVTVTTDPPQVGTPFTLTEIGEWKELVIPSGTSFTFQGTGPYLPVQYLAGHKESGNIGDPAMVQAIPIEQYLNRYVFVTGVNYDLNYAQIIRKTGSADVRINGNVVDGYYKINAVNQLQYDVADVQLEPGTEPKVYVAESADPFGVVVFGYESTASQSAYAYPGGMALRPLNPE